MRHRYTSAISIWLVTIVGLLCTILPTHGQVRSGSENPRYGVASYYKYTQPGDIPIRVHLWGYVYRPGLYEIPVGTKLSTLLSLSGGFSLGLKQWSEQRKTSLSVFSEAIGTSQAGVKYKEVWVDTQMQLLNDPVLVNNDFVVLDAQVKRKFNWRDAITIIGAAASVAIAIERLSNL